jgi:hypothetical protein
VSLKSNNQVLLYNLIFKREAIFTLGLGGVWLLGSFIWELNTGIISEPIFSHDTIDITVLHLLIGISAIYFNLVLQSTKLVGNNDFSAFFLTVVLLSGAGGGVVSFQFVGGFLLLLALVQKIQKGFNQTETVFSEFEIGVIAGLLTVTHPLFIVVFPFAYVALVNVKVNTWRGHFAVLLGFIFIVFLKLCLFIFIDHPFYFSELLGLKFAPKSLVVHGLKQQISAILLVGIFLISMKHFTNVSAQLNIKIRVFYKVWLWLSLFLLSGLLLLENTFTIPQMLLVINLPLLVLYQLAVRSFSKKIMKELAILILLLAVLFIKY